MKFHMRNLSRFNKAQFFILSAFAIVSILLLVSGWISPYTVVDTSAVVLMDEPFFFNNIKEKAFLAVNQTKNCEDLRYNLDEYKDFVEQYALSKSMNLNFDYTLSPCFPEPPKFPVVVEVNMQVRTPRINLQSNFTMKWVPS